MSLAAAGNFQAGFQRFGSGGYHLRFFGCLGEEGILGEGDYNKINKVAVLFPHALHKSNLWFSGNYHWTPKSNNLRNRMAGNHQGCFGHDCKEYKWAASKALARARAVPSTCAPPYIAETQEAPETPH